MSHPREKQLHTFLHDDLPRASAQGWRSLSRVSRDFLVAVDNEFVQQACDTFLELIVNNSKWENTAVDGWLARFCRKR